MKRKAKAKPRAKFRACPKCGSNDLLVQYHKRHPIRHFDWERDDDLYGCDKPKVDGLTSSNEHLFVHCPAMPVSGASSYSGARKGREMSERIEDVMLVCDTCGSTFRLGECEPKDGYPHDGPYDGEIGCPVADCGGTMREFER